MPQEAVNRRREIVREVAVQYAVAEKRFRSFSTGRRHVGQQDLLVRMALGQLADQWLRSARFAYGDGMNPDDRTRCPLPVKPESLTDVRQIGRLPARPHRQSHQGKWHQQPHQQPVECVCHSKSGWTSRMAPTTSSTPGGWPILPR